VKHWFQACVKVSDKCQALPFPGDGISVEKASPPVLYVMAAERFISAYCTGYLEKRKHLHAPKPS
jgi:hypothetical protein